MNYVSNITYILMSYQMIVSIIGFKMSYYLLILLKCKYKGVVMKQVVTQAIISSYNDMLSAHQPFENYPQLIKQAVRDMGSVVQFAGVCLRLSTSIQKAKAGALLAK